MQHPDRTLLEAAHVELWEVWRAAGRGRWFVVGTVVLASVVSLVYGLSADPLYRASATVVVPLNGQAPSPTLVRQVVADYRAALATDEAYEAASEGSGIPAGELRASTRTSQVGGGDVVLVTVESGDPDALADAARSMAVAGLRISLAAELEEAASVLQLAQQRHASAAMELATVEGGSEALPPDIARELAEREVLRLEEALLQAQLAGDAPRAVTAEGLLVAAEADLVEAERAARAHSLLVAAVVRSESALEDAERRSLTVGAAHAAATKGTMVVPGEVEMVSPVGALIELVVATAVVAFVASVGILFGWVAIRRGALRAPPRLTDELHPPPPPRRLVNR